MRSACKIPLLHVCGALHVWTVCKKFTVRAHECMYVRVSCISECIAFWVQWECTNGRTLELKCAECSWRAAKSGFQSCLEILLSTLYYSCSLLFLLLPKFSLRVFVSPSLCQFNIFIPSSLNEQAIHRLPIKPLYPGSENEDTWISFVAGRFVDFPLGCPPPPSPAVQWGE